MEFLSSDWRKKVKQHLLQYGVSKYTHIYIDNGLTAPYSEKEIDEIYMLKSIIVPGWELFIYFKQFLLSQNINFSSNWSFPSGKISGWCEKMEKLKWTIFSEEVWWPRTKYYGAPNNLKCFLLIHSNLNLFLASLTVLPYVILH